MDDSALAAPRHPHRTFATPLVIAALCVGFAIQLHDGEYSPGAIGLITVALVMAIFAMVRPAIALPFSIQALGARTEGIADLLLLAGLAVELIALWLAWPGTDLPHDGLHQLLPFHVGLCLCAGLILLGCRRGARQMLAIWFPAFLVVWFAMGAWMVHASRDPHIDVWVFQQGGAAELLHGHNPYAMTYPDIYDSTAPGHQQVYGPGLSAGGRLQFGFPYPPVSLLLATLGYVAAGDHRYAQVAALALAGVFLGYARPGLRARLSAALLLLTPRAFYVLGRGWTEPFAVMLVSATLFCACRRSRGLPIALGLALATKQYMVLAVPLTFFLLGEPRPNLRAWGRLLLGALITAAVVTLPLVLWNTHAFWHSAVAVQEKAPFRWDALSYLVWYGFRGHLVTEPRTALVWSTLTALAALALALRKAPRTPAGFAAALALVLLAFFAFNKQAFCNYYFLVVGTLCAAVAVTRPIANTIAEADLNEA